jgi:tripartite-type tricarboxylate transporter receptor subunit TctC
MKLSRRTFLHLAAAATALPTMPRVASALDYPTRPVHLIVGYPPGGVTDIVARLIAPWLSERLGQSFAVENRPGASSNIATEAVARASPDGYTLLLISSANAANVTLYEKLNFDFIRDIAPIASISRNPLIMEVHPSVPAGTVPEFVAYANANPGKVNMGSAGNGTPHHLCGELFKMMTRINMLHVPYRGEAPALTDLIGGQVQVMFTPTGPSIEYIRSGTLHALAVTTSVRLEVLPDVPTVEQFVPGYEASGWFAVGTPNGTPGEIIERLNAEINAGLGDREIKARLADLGALVFLSLPADFSKHIAADTEKWAKVIREANIKPV